MDLAQKIQQLKKEKKAIILAHNYQRPEIQDLADYTGDSIELSRKAMNEKDAECIIFSAVDFMAESASILNPTKKVLLPRKDAKCPMAKMLTVNQIRQAKTKYPKVPVVLYVNTLAVCKAEADICCTSANAVEVVNALDADTILFGPDKNLAEYVAEKTGKTLIPLPSDGYCPTHLRFQSDEVKVLKMQYPNAKVLVHPECTKEMRLIADFIGSTSKICSYAKESNIKTFIVGTESGILHRLQKENPAKTFYLAFENAVCPNMKRTTPKDIYLSLKEEKHLIDIPKATAKKAQISLERMFEIG
ncbi:MAG: quinolinate synthase NadA [Nitrososphaerota archaeon]|jgi:quinolinate synthase|nr:quinolinate synthase NadA [Nitrososphaerota archaeon]